MKKNALFAVLLCLFASVVYAWPTVDVDTTNVDASTDDPSQARVDILDAFQKINDMIDDRGAVNGVASLDGSGDVPIAQIPNITGKSIDSSPVGATTPSTGAFTTLSATGAATLTTGSFTGALSSTKSCNSGYTRITPTYCLRTDGPSAISLTRDTCNSITAPSGATAVDVKYLVSAESANAIASRFTILRIYNDASCASTIIRSLAVYAHEQAATSSGTILTQVDGLYSMTPIVSGSMYVYMLDDTGNQGTAWYTIHGYWD